MKVAILTDLLDRTEEEIGVPLYCKNLVNNLQEKLGGDLFLVHYRKTNNTFYNKREEIIVSSVMNKLPLGKVFITLFGVPRKLRRKEIDIVHLIAPALYDLPIFFRSGFKKVLTVHDLFEYKREKDISFSWDDIRYWMQSKIRPVLYKLLKGKIDVFIAVSKNTKQDLMEELDVPEKKIKVIHEAPDKVFRRTSVELPDYAKLPFIVIHPMATQVVEIFNELKQRGLEHKLYFFGPAPQSLKKDTGKLIQKYNLEDEVESLGFIPQQELVALYNKADLLISYTDYEGFGLPPIEAMACGCPVLTSDVSSLPEVVGEAGLLADPGDLNQWIEKAYKVLSEEEFKRNLINRGLKRAEDFSWAATAEKTIKTYEELY